MSDLRNFCERVTLKKMRYFLCFFNHCIFCRQTEVELKKKHDQSSNSRKKIVGGHGRWLAWRAKKGSNHLHWNALSNALFSATAAWLKPPLSRTKIIDLIQSKDLFRIHRNFLDFAEFSSRIRPWHWFHTRFISRGMCDKWNVKNLSLFCFIMYNFFWENLLVFRHHRKGNDVGIHRGLTN